MPGPSSPGPSASGPSASGSAGDLVLGLGGCLDYEITWDPAVLEELVVRYAVQPCDLDTSIAVDSERSLVCSVLGFVRDGTGGERFVASSSVLEQFARRFPRRVTLGGSNVRAAIALSRLGRPSTVHLVSIDDTVRRLLPPDVTYLCSATRDSTDPHLIFQFPAGTRVRVGPQVVQAPRANRLIYVNDAPNRELVLSPGLGDLLRTARVLLVSGFNSMQDEDTVRARLRDLEHHLRSLPDDALVVYEDAGFHVAAVSRLVRDALVGRVDVHSMNEDELQAYVGRQVDLLDAAALAPALRAVQSVVPVRTLVVHTRDWSLALGADARRYRRALEAGTVLAGTRYRYGDDFTAADHERVSMRLRSSAGTALARQIEQALPGQVCCVPSVDVACSTPTTVGLGDAYVGGFVGALVEGAGRTTTDRHPVARWE